MSELTLQFIVMVDGPSTGPDIVDWLKCAFPDAKGIKINSCNLRHNWLEAWANKDADPNRTDNEDGYLFYGFELQATPMAKVDEDHQIRLAQEIVGALRKKDWKVIVCANFEDQV